MPKGVGYNRTDPGKALPVKVIDRKTKKVDEKKTREMKVLNEMTRDEAMTSHLGDRERGEANENRLRRGDPKHDDLRSTRTATTAIRKIAREKARILKGSSKKKK